MCCDHPPATLDVVLSSLFSHMASTVFCIIHRGSAGKGTKKVQVLLRGSDVSQLVLPLWSVSRLTTGLERDSCKVVIEGIPRRSKGALLT